MLSALLTLHVYLYSTNDVMTKWYYSSVISHLLNGFITLMRRVLCDNVCASQDNMYTNSFLKVKAMSL